MLCAIKTDNYLSLCLIPEAKLMNRCHYEDAKALPRLRAVSRGLDIWDAASSPSIHTPQPLPERLHRLALTSSSSRSGRQFH